MNENKFTITDDQGKEIRLVAVMREGCKDCYFHRKGRCTKGLNLPSCIGHRRLDQKGVAFVEAASDKE